MRVIRPFFRKKLYIQAIFKKISRNIVFVNKIKLKFNNLLSLYDFEYRYIFFMWNGKLEMDLVFRPKTDVKLAMFFIGIMRKKKKKYAFFKKR